jgi:putative peptide zinc metalloprotease protein
MQTLLSEHWHAVRTLRPQLRAGVQALHRRLRGKAWVLLFDPITQRFHRMSPSVYQVIALMNGQRNLDEVWGAACHEQTALADGSEHDSAAISQHELVQLLSSLYTNDLLQTQVSPDASEVFERHRRQTRQQRKQAWSNPLSIKLPLLHPDPWFERMAPLARALFSWTVLLLWIVWVLPAGVLAAQHWTALTDNLSDRVLSASNVALLWVTYPLVKGVHEWAHGMAVKAWGGRVREMGLMFIMFMPLPYVDATASYHFPSKWARAAVAAAGIMAELALGALAVYVWLMAESGLVTALAFNVILISGVSTVVVNGNPLMRYDGYFILTDLLELPNLSQRAAQYWTYLIDRYAYSARDAQPPLESGGERWWLGWYGAIAPVYRFSVSIGMVWFIASQYFFVGMALALVGAWSALVMPFWKGYKHLSEGAALARRRRTAVWRTVIAAALLLGVLGGLPLPFYSVHQAVVWLPDDAIVRAQAAGHITHTQVRAFDVVTQGQLLLTLHSPPLQAEHGVALASVAQAQAQLRQAEVDNPVRAQGLRETLTARLAKLADTQQRVQALGVMAATSGQWTPAAPTELVGRYAKRGEVLGYVVRSPSALVRVAVTQEDMELIRARVERVDVRLAHQLRTSVPGHIHRLVPGGELDLVSAALGSSGGGEVPVDPANTKGTRALKRVFDVEVQLEQASPIAAFGDRAHVRFTLGATPLAMQWFLRLRQLFLVGLHV